jgi:hypothetical protein
LIPAHNATIGRVRAKLPKSARPLLDPIAGTIFGQLRT